jgi:hypothetical protein
MSEQTAPGFNGPWPVLTMNQRRVLGVLVEKSKTTPDAYPMTMNALISGSNQKSNRDPILELDEADVEEALEACKNLQLVTKIFGGRSEKWRMLLYEAWKVDKIEIAILAELLLRGPQTEGELRTRAVRMEPIEDLETLRERLKPLVERNMVIYLTSEGRGAVVTHGFHDKNELARLRNQHSGQAQPRPVEPPPRVGVPTHTPSPVSASTPAVPQWDGKAAIEAAIAPIRQELAEAKREMAEMRKKIDELTQGLSAARQEVINLKQALGG